MDITKEDTPKIPHRVEFGKVLKAAMTFSLEPSMDVNILNDRGQTILFFVYVPGSTPPYTAVDVTKYVLDMGLDPTVEDNNGVDAITRKATKIDLPNPQPLFPLFYENPHFVKNGFFDLFVDCIISHQWPIQSRLYAYLASQTRFLSEKQLEKLRTLQAIMYVGQTPIPGDVLSIVGRYLFGGSPPRKGRGSEEGEEGEEGEGDFGDLVRRALSTLPRTALRPPTMDPRAVAAAIDSYKHFVNDVYKRTSLQNAFTSLGLRPGAFVLDLASGRGNDLYKYAVLGLNVVGLEISRAQYDEAIKRYRQYRGRTPRPINVSYCLGSMSNAADVRRATKGRRYPIVVCNFAMNYVFDPANDYAEAKVFLRNVADSLWEGKGLFIGAATDGDVLSLQREVSSKVESPLVYFESVTPHSYRFRLSTPFFKDLATKEEVVIEEYIIHKVTLRRLAEGEGLEMVGMNNLSEWIPAGDRAVPREISDLYFTFCFKKR